MLKLAAYADRLSVRPGETIRFHASNATGHPVTARLVRVISADANPAGPGLQLEAVAAPVRQLAAPQPAQDVRGSYAVVACDALELPDVVQFALDVMPTRIDGRRQGLMSWRSGDGSVQIDLALTGDGHVDAVLAAAGRTTARVEAPTPLAAMSWHEVSLVVDRARQGGQLLIASRPWGASAEGANRASSQSRASFEPFEVRPSGGRIVIGALLGRETATAFDGRIQAPRISEARGSPEAHSKLVAHWDFSLEMSSDRIVDVGPHAFHGRLVNSPTRAVRGANWTGREMCWRHAPGEYAAIHFHSDDLDDCRWPSCFEWTVPEGTRSANYALLLEAGGERDNVPFFVVPPRSTPGAKVAVLVSTFTYTVYANHVRPEWTSDPKWVSDWREQARRWGASLSHPGDHPEYGLSTYNTHADGSGIAISSWHRPMLNIRIGYITYPYPEIRGSGGRHYQPDTHLTAWLEAKGIDYDIITDWELHSEGYDLLRAYPVLLTGTHPEYHTREMLDALTRYRDEGGRFCYLGGNGFYWKIALSPYKPGVIEIRRGEGGIRAWAAEPGEYYNQFDGEYGGLWRRNGRPPQMLSGIGFTAQGNFVGSYYRKTAAAADPKVAWMFDGIPEEIIGDFGLSGHGAAGFELDRADKRLGTPAGAIVVAQSENHPPEAPWVLVPEEQLTHLVTWPGQPPKELIRADMTFFPTAGGKGAVFSTGSITFCGSLPTNGYDNNVSRLLENVVRRFLDPRPFAA